MHHGDHDRILSSPWFCLSAQLHLTILLFVPGTVPSILHIEFSGMHLLNNSSDVIVLVLLTRKTGSVAAYSVSPELRHEKSRVRISI